MKIIIAGSRHSAKRHEIYQAVYDSKFDIREVIVSNHYTFSDLGEEWARENNIPVIKFESSCQHPVWYPTVDNMNFRMATYADGLVAVCPSTTNRYLVNLIGKVKVYWNKPIYLYYSKSRLVRRYNWGKG
jgi:hypothetical protein